MADEKTRLKEGDAKEGEEGEEKAPKESCCDRFSKGIVVCYQSTCKCIATTCKSIANCLSYCWTPVKDNVVNTIDNADKSRHKWKDPNYNEI